MSRSSQGNSNYGESGSSSTNSKSKVSKTKVKKSFIPLRQTNIGYLELHHQHHLHHQFQKQFKSKDKPLPQARIKTSLSTIEISSTSLENPTVCRKVAATAIRSIYQESSKFSLTRGPNNNEFGRIPRSIHSTRTSLTNKNEFLEEISCDSNSAEGLHVDLQQKDLKLKPKPSSAKLRFPPVSGSNNLPKSESPSNSSSSSGSRSCYLSEFSKKVGQVASRTRGYFLCPICNEPLNNPAIISCGHVFCMRCVCSWFEGQENCPCCRFHIAGKDITDETVLTKEFPAISSTLASIFNVGNIYDRLKAESEISLTSDKASTTNTSYLNLPNSMVTHFRRLLDEEEKSSGINDLLQRKGHKKRGENNKCCVISAAWFLRQAYMIQMSRSGSGPEDCFLNMIPSLISMEADKGTDSTRDSLLRRVMLHKIPEDKNESTNYTIPYNDPSKKLRNGRNPQNRRLRFRLPTLQNLLKMLIVSLLFMLIFLAVHLFDDHDSTKPKKNNLKLDFSKMDLIVYSVFVFMMVSYTETERMVYLRRRSERNRRRRRRRNRPVQDTIDDFILT